MYDLKDVVNGSGLLDPFEDVDFNDGEDLGNPDPWDEDDWRDQLVDFD